MNNQHVPQRRDVFNFNINVLCLRTWVVNEEVQKSRASLRCSWGVTRYSDCFRFPAIACWNSCKRIERCLDIATNSTHAHACTAKQAHVYTRVRKDSVAKLLKVAKSKQKSNHECWEWTDPPAITSQARSSFQGSCTWTTIPVLQLNRSRSHIPHGTVGHLSKGQLAAAWLPWQVVKVTHRHYYRCYCCLVLLPVVLSGSTGSSLLLPVCRY
jgi:hypothetical protein